jgi:predicted transport protein
MNLYQHNHEQLVQLKEIPFRLEKDIQKLFEANLKTIMGLDFVKSEFNIKNKRIDTLGFDPETHSFIIIEYKRDKNHSVVDQGLSYLNLMLEYKADFIIEYNENLKQNLKRDDVDWSQTRIVFVSTSFTENQKSATNFKDLAIELWEIKQYENGSIIIDSIKKSAAAPSIKQIATQSETLKAVVKEIRVYTEEDHINNKSDEVKELYELFKSAIMNLSDNIELVPKKTYIAFKIKSNVVDVELQANSLKFWINLKIGQLNDPLNLMRDVSMLKGHNGNGDYELTIRDTQQIEYIMSLIKQAILL